MPTPDGISDRDWNGIHKLALFVLKDAEPARMRLRQQAVLTRLDKLQRKYGPLPSLLATKADFVENPAEKVKLLQAAYRAAKRRRDLRNLAYVTHSLAEHYIADRPDRAQGRRWLTLFKKFLRYDDSPSWALKEYRRLRIHASR